MSDLASLPPLLLPRPASLTVHSLEGGAPSASPAAESIDTSLPHPDAFRLSISSEAVSIDHRSDRGLRHARAALEQLTRQYGDLPQLEIADHPAIDTRGLMLDVSRDRVPSRQHLDQLVPVLGNALRVNHLQLYTEHTFAYSDHQEVWLGWEPITADDVAHTQERAVAHGVELAANQNCFGHLERWLRHPRYAALAETHGEWVFDRFTRSGPFSVCPDDPGSIDLVRRLLDELLPLFDSSLVNVGCDETYDVGQGRSKDAVEQRGKATVYYDFLDQVFDAVRSHGKRPMFWADVALSHPESVGRIADDAIALAWGYEADAEFDRWCDVLTGAGKTAWVCPGTSSWRSITGRTATRRANLSAGADAAAKWNLPGLLITDWGDSGHHQTWPISLLAIAEGADRAWNAGRPGDTDPRSIALHCFGDRSLGIATWLDELGDIDLHLRARAGRAWFEGRGQPLENASVHAADLAEPWDSDAIAITADEFGEIGDRLESLRAERPRVSDQLINRELDHTLDRAELAIRRAIARRTNEPVDADLIDLAETVTRDHRRLWTERSRPGLGLDDSSSYDQRLLDELRAH